jgi:hypothetical protein
LAESTVELFPFNLNSYYFVTFIFSVHFCLPKNEPKRAPRSSRPFRLPCASRCWRDAKNSSASSGLKQFSVLFRQHLRCSAGQHGVSKNKGCLFFAASLLVRFSSLASCQSSAVVYLPTKK